MGESSEKNLSEHNLGEVPLTCESSCASIITPCEEANGLGSLDTNEPTSFVDNDIEVISSENICEETTSSQERPLLLENNSTKNEELVVVTAYSESIDENTICNPLASVGSAEVLVDKIENLPIQSLEEIPSSENNSC